MRTLRREWPLAAFCAAVAIVALYYNLLSSPDTLYDEAAYTWAAQQVALGWHLTLDTQPLFVHPPLMFLAQAGWLRLTGAAAEPLAAAIRDGRILSAAVGTADVLLIAALAYRLADCAPARRRGITALVTVVAALDPVLVRYDRQNVIEPFALLVSLLALHAAWRLRGGSALRYVAVTGLLDGLALLTNEITIFLILVIPVFALLERDRRLIRRTAAALGIGIGIALVFFAWAVELGLPGAFVQAQTISLQRLAGIVQITGLNQPGTSLTASLLRSVSQYSSTYIVLAAGFLALLWCWSRRHSSNGNFVTAWLTASYAFGAYIVADGTLNEQFFVYLLPGAIVGAAFGLDALLAAWSWRRFSSCLGVAGGAACASVIGLSAVSWTVNYTSASDGVARVDQYIQARLPACAAVNASGDPQKYSLLAGGRDFEYFSVGPAALADGVHYFLLAPVDAAERSGGMSPALEAWIRANGEQVVSYPSQVYDTVQLWYVPASRYDADADVIDVAGGVYVNTVGSRCGGYQVTDSSRGAFYSGYQALGGKAVLGDPDSGVASVGGRSVQLFDGAALATAGAGGNGGGGTGVTALPIVLDLAEQAPARYRAAGLPPVRLDLTAAQRSGLLTSKAITQAYLRGGSYSGAVARFGAPLGPPAALAGGGTAQAFADVVLEVPPGGGAVRTVAVAAVAAAAGIISLPGSARHPVAPPALPQAFPSPPAEPTTVLPFVITLGAVLGGYGAVVLAVVIWRFRKRGKHARSGRPPGPGGDRPGWLASAPDTAVAGDDRAWPAAGDGRGAAVHRAQGDLGELAQRAAEGRRGVRRRLPGRDPQ